MRKSCTTVQSSSGILLPTTLPLEKSEGLGITGCFSRSLLRHPASRASQTRRQSASLYKEKGDSMCLCISLCCCCSTQSLYHTSADIGIRNLLSLKRSGPLSLSIPSSILQSTPVSLLLLSTSYPKSAQRTKFTLCLTERVSPCVCDGGSG